MKKIFSEEIDEKDNVISVILAGIFMFIYLYAVSKTDLKSKNLMIYISGCLIFAIVFWLTSFILGKCKKLKINSGIVAIVLALLEIAWGIGAYFDEIINNAFHTDFYKRHIIGAKLYFPILIVSTLVLLCIILSYSAEKQLSRLIRISVSLVMIILQMAAQWRPNILSGGDGTADIWHMDAYTTSIINASYGVPYSIENNSIYGHYGIFYALPVKILHVFMNNRWEAVTMSIVLISGIMFAVEYILFDKLINNDVIFVCLVIASGVPTYQMIGYMCEVYYQIYPHRILFQVIMLLMAYLMIRYREKKLVTVLTWILVGVSIIWNLESAIAVIISISALSWYLYAEEKGWNIKGALIQVGRIIICFAGAYVFFNIYNIIAGGSWQPLSIFLYPYEINKLEIIEESFASASAGISAGNGVLLTIGKCIMPLFRIEGYNTLSAMVGGSMHEDYTGPFGGAFFGTILSLGILAMLFLKTIRKQLTQKMQMLMFSAGMCLVIMVYPYAHYKAYQTCVFCTEILVMIGLIVDYGIARWKQEKHLFRIEKIIVIGMLTVISCMTLGTVTHISDRIEINKETIWVTQGFYEFCDQLNNELPDGTVCFGNSVPQLCAAMDRDPLAYVQDCPDYVTESYEAIMKIVNNENTKYIFMSEDVAPYMATEDYELVQTFDYMERGIHRYCLYKRI